MGQDTGPEDTIARWFAAWSDMSFSERDELLATCLTPDATYADRKVDLEGRDEIAAFVARFVSRDPSARFEVLAPIRHHGSVSLVAWRYVAGDGTTIVDGFEFEEFAGDGRLRRMIAFWEPPVQAARSS